MAQYTVNWIEEIVGAKLSWLETRKTHEGQSSFYQLYDVYCISRQISLNVEKSIIHKSPSCSPCYYNM